MRQLVTQTRRLGSRTAAGGVLLVASLLIGAVSGATPAGAATRSASCRYSERGNGDFDVSWARGSGVYRYIIRRTTTIDGPFWRASVDAPRTSFLDPAPLGGSVVSYRVESIDANNQMIGQPTLCTDSAAAGTTVRLIGVGDMVDCPSANRPNSAAKRVNSMLARHPDGSILALGDLGYAEGGVEEFRCFNRVVGEHKSRMLPVVGNHEYRTPKARGYIDYFQNLRAFSGGNNGPVRRVTYDDSNRSNSLYYEQTIGDWQLIVLDSNCDQNTYTRGQVLPSGQRATRYVNGCDRDNKQYQWLKRLLEQPRSQNVCRIVAMHHPRWASHSAYGSAAPQSDLIDLLYAHQTDLIVAGHSHKYERFRPQDNRERSDPKNGFQLMTLGTGGVYLKPVTANDRANSVVQISAHGITEFELGPDSFSWKFIDLDDVVLDSGSRRCITSR